MWWQWLCFILIFSPISFVILMIILDALDPDAYIDSYIRTERKMKEKESWKRYKSQTSLFSIFKGYYKK